MTKAIAAVIDKMLVLRLERAIVRNFDMSTPQMFFVTLFLTWASTIGSGA